MSLSVNSGGHIVWSDNKQRRVINSIHTWMDAFLIFASVFLKAHPQRAQELLKYASLIRTAASKFHGWGWRWYDAQFRMRQQRQPQRSWAAIDGELWTLIVATPPAHNFPVQSRPNTNSNRNMFRNSSTSRGQGRRPSGGRKESLCFAFNGSGCDRSTCRFSHKCTKCQALDHGAQFCKR